MKFYTRDWQADSNLRLCSFAARGLWIEMLCLMNQSSNRGYLEHCGKPIPDCKLAALVGGDNQEVNPLIKELEDNTVFSRDKRGCIYSRRMIREEGSLEHFRRNGAKGGNPTLKTKNNHIPDTIATSRITPVVKGRVNPPMKRPSIQEINDYAKEQSIDIDASYFFDFYEARGWMAGKTRMKDWRAAVRTWGRNNYQKPNKTPDKSNFPKIGDFK